MFLENLYAKLAPHEKEILIAAIKSHSVMSRGHFNFLRGYDFPEEKMRDSCGILSAKITD